MGHAAGHLALHGEQALQLARHAVECRRQPPHRVVAGVRHTRLQVAGSDLRRRALQRTEAKFQAPHEHVHGQPDQRQPEQADAQQQVRRVGIHRKQRPEVQNPARAGHRREDVDGVATPAERHHRVAFVEAPALVVVEIGAVAGHQRQVVAEAMA